MLIQGQHLIEDYPYILTKYILYTHHIFPCKWIFNHFQSESSFFQVLLKQNFESYCLLLGMGTVKLLIYWSWNSHLILIVLAISFINWRRTFIGQGITQRLKFSVYFIHFIINHAIFDTSNSKMLLFRRWLWWVTRLFQSVFLAVIFNDWRLIKYMGLSRSANPNSFSSNFIIKFSANCGTTFCIFFLHLHKCFQIFYLQQFLHLTQTLPKTCLNLPS